LTILGLELRDFVLARQALFCLSHTSSPFCSGQFGNRVLLFAWAVLNHISPIYVSHSSWDNRCTPPHTAFFSVEMCLLWENIFNYIFKYLINVM
jgi:hypothetical protein